MGCLPLCRRILASVTVEPLAVLTVIGVYFLIQGELQFFYYKLCMINYNDTNLCRNLSAHHEDEDTIQTETSRWTLYTDAICYGLTAFSLLILGAWSDRVGRKPPLILSCVGAIVLGVVSLISAIWIKVPMPFMLVGWAAFGITGSQGILYSSMLSYIADITSVENRTIRMGILESFISFSVVIGLAVAGLLSNGDLFQLLFGIFILLFLLAILYIIFCLKEPRSLSASAKSKAPPSHTPETCSKETDPLIGETDFCGGSTGQVPQETEPSTSSICGQLFRRETWTASFVVCVRKRPHHGRLVLNLLLVCLFLLNLEFFGLSVVFVLYALKSPLKWSPFMISMCSAATGLANGVLLLTVFPLARLAGIGARVIIGFCLVLLCLSFGALGFARSTPAVWLATAPMAVFELVTTSYYGMMSTLVSPDEQGRTLALVNIMITLSHLAASVIFNNLYPATLHVLSGALSFFVFSGINFVQLCLFLCVAFLLKNRQV